MQRFLPQHDVAIEPGCLPRLPELLDEWRAERVFLVVDEAACDHSGARPTLDAALRTRDVCPFAEFEPNPKLGDVDRGRELFERFAPDVTLALGGGTAIDLAKLIGSCASSGVPSRDIALGAALIDASHVPLIVIPTTSGTGSEATHFAVVYVDGTKYSVAAPELLPTVALVDSRLTHSLPAGLTTATGLDAFCQAIESIWSVGANEASVRDASEAVRLIHSALPIAVHSPTPRAREAMARGAHLAGRAINVSKTTLPHALSYALTSRYGLPHGLAVATTLAAVFRFNAGLTEADCLDPRGPQHVRERLALIAELLGVNGTEAAAHALEAFIRTVGGTPSPFPEPIATAHDWRRITEQVNPVRMSNNPRQATPEALADLFPS